MLERDLYIFICSIRQIEPANSLYEFLDRAESNGAFFDIDTFERTGTVPFLTSFVNPRRVFFGSYNQ